ncbi:MAG: hypothetical protein K0R63_220 [Rickettsiales bacterium]|jgi:hypothetical protein|nr:hypothetical protein [Rickettsiales bacterium]
MPKNYQHTGEIDKHGIRARITDIQQHIDILKISGSIYAPKTYTYTTAELYIQENILKDIHALAGLVVQAITLKFGDEFGRTVIFMNQGRAYRQRNIVQEQSRWLSDIARGLFVERGRGANIFPTDADKDALGGFKMALEDFEYVLINALSVVQELDLRSVPKGPLSRFGRKLQKFIPQANRLAKRRVGLTQEEKDLVA